MIEESEGLSFIQTVILSVFLLSAAFCFGVAGGIHLSSGETTIELKTRDESLVVINECISSLRKAITIIERN